MPIYPAAARRFLRRYLGRSGQTIPIVAGDKTAEDGEYMREFYFKTANSTGASDCVFKTDFEESGHSISLYTSPVAIDPSTVATFGFLVQAVDRLGNITKSRTMPVAIQGSLSNGVTSVEACGPPRATEAACLEPDPAIRAWMI